EYPCLKAREGREKQRYDGETRLVVGCAVIKDNSILMVSSHHTKGKWVLPKGGWESDETALEAAKRETFEEAGVEGDIGESISTVTYQNKLKKPVLWTLYPMECTKIYDWWPESENRSRKWVKEEELESLFIDPLSKVHIPHI
ncbi:hypothetical protein WA577_000496, partial [Blastocystis sp. JDR]